MSAKLQLLGPRIKLEVWSVLSARDRQISGGGGEGGEGEDSRGLQLRWGTNFGSPISFETFPLWAGRHVRVSVSSVGIQDDFTQKWTTV